MLLSNIANCLFNRLIGFCALKCSSLTTQNTSKLCSFHIIPWRESRPWMKCSTWNTVKMVQLKLKKKTKKEKNWVKNRTIFYSNSNYHCQLYHWNQKFRLHDNFFFSKQHDSLFFIQMKLLNWRRFYFKLTQENATAYR